MKTETIVLRNGANYNYTIHIDGLKELMRFLGNSDPELRKAIREGLNDAAKPVLNKARANAQAIARNGTFASSLQIGTRSNGAVFLYSRDPAAGVKEFAHAGAKYKPKPTDKRINARKMSSFPVGVPHRANPPRVMIPAVNDSVNEVKDQITVRLEEVLRRANG